MTAAYYDDPAYVYGTAARLYDEVPADYDPNRLHWRFEVAWNSTYVYFSEPNGTTEAVRAYDCYWNRGRQTFVNQDGDGLTRMNPGRLVITLSNHDGQYDPYNASSPLYPNIVPGKFMRLGVRRASQKEYTWRFAGVVDNIRPVDNPSTRERVVEISAVDGWGFLQEAQVYLPASVNATVTDIIPDVLYAIDFPMIWGSSVVADSYNFPYFWSGDNDARKVLHDLAETQDARLWIAGDGKLWYRNRTLAQNLKASVTESDILRDIPIDMPWNNNWNYIRVILKNPSSGILTKNGSYVWRVTNEHVISPGESISITGKYSMPSLREADIPSGYGVQDFEFLLGMYYVNTSLSPSPTEKPMLRWKFRTATGGGGVDRSGYVELVFFKDGGDAFEAELKNNYSNTVFSTDIYIPANVIFRLVGGEPHIASDHSNGRTKKVVAIETPYLLNAGSFTTAVIQEVANYYAAHILAANRLPIITFEARPDMQFMDILNRFNLASATKGISSDYRVGFIQEKWLSPNGQAVQTMIQTEPYFDDPNHWRWDSNSTFDVSTIFGA